MKPTAGSLFSGIGGIDLGLERAGFEIKWQVEIDDYASRVLAKHWPGVQRYRDVREVGRHNLEPVDLIAGGFPCQDISDAGKRAGIDGERSGLWSEFARIVGELRPRYVLVENVTALLHRGMGRVLGDLATLGYDAEWEIVSACSFGAPHTRERLFIVAYTNGPGRLPARLPASIQANEAHGLPWRPGTGCGRPRSSVPRPVGVAYGVPNRLHRLRGLGNAVVPQVAQWIGKRILEA